MTFFPFLLSNSDKKKMVDGKLKCMIGGDEKRRERTAPRRERRVWRGRGKKRGERGAIGMRGGAGGKKTGWGAGEEWRDNVL